MSAWVSKQTGNWTRTSDNADSPWYDAGAQTALASYPGAADTSDTVTIGDGVTATQNITLDGNPPSYISSITQGDNTSFITVSTARILLLKGNPGVNYGGTNTSGLFRVSGASGGLTITHNQGAGTVAVSNTSSGRAIVTSGSQLISVSNSGGDALNSSGSGHCIYQTAGATTITGNIIASAGTGYGTNGTIGALNITGNITASGTGTGIRTETQTVTVTGDISNSGTGGAWNQFTGTGNLVGNASSSSGRIAIQLSNGTFNWTGSRTIAASAECMFQMNGGTLNLATASAALSLTNSGTFGLQKTGGTLNTACASLTGSASYTLTWGGNTTGTLTNSSTAGNITSALNGLTGANSQFSVTGTYPNFTVWWISGALTSTGATVGTIYTASIVRQFSTSYATILGGTDAQKGIITGPTLPAAANVRLSGSAQYGYAGALFDGTISMPNSGTPTGTEDATSDACVVSGKNYGAGNARTGTASAGGGGGHIIGA